MKYLTAEQVLFIHARIIDETGGAHGVRDLGLLKSAVNRPRATFDEKDLYHDLFQKASALMESLIGNHPFIDGNKRTAVSSVAVFLERNGFRLEGTQAEIETITLDMALKNISAHDASTWLKNHSEKK